MMKHRIAIPNHIHEPLMSHLFQGDVEQGAFLLAQAEKYRSVFQLSAFELIRIPPTGWNIQSAYHLELSEAERARIMKSARDRGCSLIECHSHPHSGDYAEFSYTDRLGLNEFVPYVRWKLDSRPYGALVWGENSFDGRIWYDDFAKSHLVSEVIITGAKKVTYKHARYGKLRLLRERF